MRARRRPRVNGTRRIATAHDGSPGGFALILSIGVLSILLLLALSFLMVAAVVSARNAPRLARVAAGLASASGMEYAAARLFRDGHPLHVGAMETRGDDWTCRQAPGAVPLHGIDNPSFSHGDPWTDIDGDGARDPDEPPAADPNGDGRFRGRSGRLRDGSSPGSLSFSLRIGSTGGRLPVNAGFLDAADRNGNGIPDHGDLLQGPVQGNPPYKFLLVNVGIAHALNNLGAILLPEDHPRRFWQGSPGTPLATSNPDEPILYSLFGDDAVERRPPGGYADLDALKAALAPVGYTEEDIDRLAPYIDFSRGLTESPQMRIHLAGPTPTPWGVHETAGA